MLRVAEIDQRIQAGHSLEDHVPALAAVTSVRSAEFDELLTAKAYGACAARAGTHENLGLIEEMHGGQLGDADGQGNLWRKRGKDLGTAIEFPPAPIRVMGCANISS